MQPPLEVAAEIRSNCATNLSLNVADRGHVMQRKGLARARVAVGLSQEQLAQAIGVDRKTVYRWEAGLRDPQPRLRGSLARSLDIELADLDALLRGHDAWSMPKRSTVTTDTRADHVAPATTAVAPEVSAIAAALGRYRQVDHGPTLPPVAADLAREAAAVDRAWMASRFASATVRLPKGCLVTNVWCLACRVGWRLSWR